MNIATLNEPKAAAKEKYREYLAAVKTRHSKEYVALKNAYREMSKGRQVIDIVDVIRTAGVDSQMRPKLAIIRADAKLCYYRSTGTPTFSMTEWGDSVNTSVVLPPDTLPRIPANSGRFRAVVPSIPPRLLPDGPLEKYHVLWEAEWERLPVDPMLLRHLGRNLYAVLAHWDLTPLERAVLQPMPKP